MHCRLLRLPTHEGSLQDGESEAGVVCALRFAVLMMMMMMMMMMMIMIMKKEMGGVDDVVGHRPISVSSSTDSEVWKLGTEALDFLIAVFDALSFFHDPGVYTTCEMTRCLAQLGLLVHHCMCILYRLPWPASGV
jgi:hypothetical protein